MWCFKKNNYWLRLTVIIIIKYWINKTKLFPHICSSAFTYCLVKMLNLLNFRRVEPLFFLPEYYIFLIFHKMCSVTYVTVPLKVEIPYYNRPFLATSCWSLSCARAHTYDPLTLKHSYHFDWTSSLLVKTAIVWWHKKVTNKYWN